MAQNLFDFVGTANRSYTLLDANFTELYDLRNKVYTSAFAAATYAFAIDGSLRVITGDTTAQVTRVSATNVSGQWQIKGATLSGSSQGMFTYESSAAGSCPYLLVGRSRNATIGSHTVVQSGDFLGAWSAAGSDGTQFTEACRITAEVDGTPGTSDMPGRWVFRTTADGASSPSEAMRIDSNQAVLFSSATGGFGYRTGAGGTVTQATSKSTGVTLNTVCGQVTMNNAALAANTAVSFTLTNSAISTGDRIILNHMSGGTFGAYAMDARAGGSGSATVMLRNLTAGSLSEAVVIGFTVIRSVTA